VEVEIGEAVDYFVHNERQSSRRFVSEALRLDGHDRRSRQFPHGVHLPGRRASHG
jgi:hypothetical protein